MPHWIVVTILIALNVIVWPTLISFAIHEFRSTIKETR